MPATQSEPGGAGEFGVAALMAAVANAYARATGTLPTSFPINHSEPLGVSRHYRPSRQPPVAHRRLCRRRSDGHLRLYPQWQAGERRLRGRDASALGYSAISSASMDRSRTAAWTFARPAPATSTARRSIRARCRSATCSRPIRSPRSRACRRPSESRCIRCSQAWLKLDVAQCGYCQPGQIMVAVARVNEVKAAGRQITDADIDSLRNVCRCGTYPRIREAIVEADADM